MSLVLPTDSPDASQVAPTFTLRPKPDRRRTPRVVLAPNVGLVCFSRPAPSSSPVVAAQAADLRVSLVALDRTHAAR